MWADLLCAERNLCPGTTGAWGGDLRAGEQQCWLFRCVSQFLLIRPLALDPVLQGIPFFSLPSGDKIKETTRKDWYGVDFALAPWVNWGICHDPDEYWFLMETRLQLARRWSRALMQSMKKKKGCQSISLCLTRLDIFSTVIYVRRAVHLYLSVRGFDRQSCYVASMRWDVYLNSLGFKKSCKLLWNHQVYFPVLCKLLKSCASLALPY